MAGASLLALLDGGTLEMLTSSLFDAPSGIAAGALALGSVTTAGRFNHRFTR